MLVYFRAGLLFVLEENLEKMVGEEFRKDVFRDVFRLVDLNFLSTFFLRSLLLEHSEVVRMKEEDPTLPRCSLETELNEVDVGKADVRGPASVFHPGPNPS